VKRAKYQMPTRAPVHQALHDSVIHAAADLYRQRGRNVGTNPGTEKNQSWAGRYIDLIANEPGTPERAWLVEFETDDSVTLDEAQEQWADYDRAFNRWYLAVPALSREFARILLEVKQASRCTLIVWRKQDDGTFTFDDLPGL
jgi:hypothetical protein